MVKPQKFSWWSTDGPSSFLMTHMVHCIRPSKFIDFPGQQDHWKFQKYGFWQIQIMLHHTDYARKA